MKHEASGAGTWRALSNEAAGVLEKVGQSVVAVHARRRIPSSGVHWSAGIIVTADHTIERDEDISVTLRSRSGKQGNSLAARNLRSHHQVPRRLYS